MTYALTYGSFAGIGENYVGFCSVTANTGASWYASTQPHGHDVDAVARILAAKNAAPVAVLKPDELLSWLNK